MLLVKDVETEMSTGIKEPNRAPLYRNLFDDFKGIFREHFQV